MVTFNIVLYFHVLGQNVFGSSFNKLYPLLYNQQSLKDKDKENWNYSET